MAIGKKVKTFENKLKLLYKYANRLGRSNFYKIIDNNDKTYAIYYDGKEAIKSVGCSDVKIEPDNKDILKLYNVNGVIRELNVEINPFIFNDENSRTLARIHEGKFIYSQGFENDTYIIKADNYKNTLSNLYIFGGNYGDYNFFQYLKIIDTKHGKFDNIFKFYGEIDVTKFKSLREDCMYYIEQTLDGNEEHIILYRNSNTLKIDMAYRYRKVIQVSNDYFLGVKNIQGKINIENLGKYSYDILDTQGVVLSNIEAYGVDGHIKKKYHFYKYLHFLENYVVEDEKYTIIDLENGCKSRITTTDEIIKTENIKKPYNEYIIHR